MKIKYKIYNPGGNITALVLGDKYNLEEKILINNKIMKENSKIEQVGFVSLEQKKLTMAGGEFCGNATRCAMMYYGIKNNESIIINNKYIKGGKISFNKFWCEIPIDNYDITLIDENIYKVELDEIMIIIIYKELSNKCIEEELKSKSKQIIKKYNLNNNKAVGIVFLERISNDLKIYPVIWVRDINTLFLENACGTATVTISMLETMLLKKSKKYKVLQPSGEYLQANIIFRKEKIVKARLIGKIYTDDKINIITV